MPRSRQTHRAVALAGCMLMLTLQLGPARPALAQEERAASTSGDEEGPALWELRFAAFGRYATAYPGSSDTHLTLVPFPIPVYRGSFLSFGENLDQVARGEITETPRMRLGIDLDFTFGERSENIEVRHGMPDLHFMLELGPELEIKLNNRTPEEGEFFIALQLRAAVSLDGLDPSSRGYLLNPEFEYRRDQMFGGDNLLSVRWKPTWASERYMDFYYQVDPAFATATRPVYDASSGYLGSKFTAALTRQVNDRTSIGMSASFYLYRGAENRTSPLFRRNTGFSIQAVWLKTLAESDKRVMPRARR